jgi:hypothetical protein
MRRAWKTRCGLENERSFYFAGCPPDGKRAGAGFAAYF